MSMVKILCYALYLALLNAEAEVFLKKKKKKIPHWYMNHLNIIIMIFYKCVIIWILLVKFANFVVAKNFKFFFQS